MIATSAHEPAGLAARSTRNPSSVAELSAQATSTPVLLRGAALVLDGEAGGVVAHALLENAE